MKNEEFRIENEEGGRCPPFSKFSILNSKFFILVLLAALAPPLRADFRAFTTIPVDLVLERQLNVFANEALAELPDLTPDNLSITIVDLTKEPRRASFRGDAPYHPASVVKLFFLVCARDAIGRGKLVEDAELQRAMRDMIVDSSNDATSYVVDRLTGTTSGPELYGRAWKKWVYKRNLMNRYFAKLGYGINVNGKTWSEDIYGRDKQLLGFDRKGRNRGTSDAAAALMLSIVARRAVSAKESETMLTLLRRPIRADKTEKTDSQVVEFSGERLPTGTKLWSKAGWTSEVRHDVAYVELPTGERYIVAIFTRGGAGDLKRLPEIGEGVRGLIERSSREDRGSELLGSSRRDRL
ncbi:MAG: serine hydrolase [Thermoanaerobaculia bacterium]